MARFVFRLQPLLRARRLAEQAQQRRVGELEQQRIGLEDTLRRRQQVLADSKVALRDRLTGTLQLHDLRVHANAALQVMRQAQRLVLQLAGVHKRLEEARADLLAATQRRRALELLRDQRFEQWRADQNRAEAATLDDLAAAAAARKDRTP